MSSGGPLRKRQVHGKTASGERAPQTVWESVGTDEMRSPPPGSAAPLEHRKNGTWTSAGASAAARLRWAAAKVPDFASKELEFVPAPDFAPFDKGRRELTTKRRQELHESTGGVSAAVGATLRGEAWLTAFAEYWAKRAAETGDPDAMDRAMRFFKSASGERARAWDMASTEAQSRPQRNSFDRVRASLLEGGSQ